MAEGGTVRRAASGYGTARMMQPMCCGCGRCHPLVGVDRCYSPCRLAGELWHHGVERVDRMFGAILEQFGRQPSLADQARCAGLLGAAVRDLKPAHAFGDLRQLVRGGRVRRLEGMSVADRSSMGAGRARRECSPLPLGESESRRSPDELQREYRLASAKKLRSRSSRLSRFRADQSRTRSTVAVGDRTHENLSCHTPRLG